MSEEGFQVVTGAFGFTGRYIASRLLSAGIKVRTLTDSPRRANPFGSSVTAMPFNFADPGALTGSLRGAKVLYNTYWVRFGHVGTTHSQAVANSRTLFQAARDAGVKRIVHLSIANPSADSPLGYFRRKAEVEAALAKTGVGWAILRPPLLFGPGSILVNNIAWMLRHFPVFALLGDGSYRIRPIHVDDLAKLAVKEGGRKEDVLIDAVGPETYTYRQLVEMIGEAIGKRRLLIPVPLFLGYAAGFLMGKLLGDIVMTRDELRGLAANLLYTDAPPAGTISLREWTRENAADLGARYMGELARRRDREKAYTDIR